MIADQSPDQRLRPHLDQAQAALAVGDLMTAERAVFQALQINHLDGAALQLMGRCRYLYLINTMTVALGRLKVQGFTPTAIADIGAYHGWWTRGLKRVYPDARVLMVEAQDGCVPFLEETRQAYAATVDYRIGLLGAEPRRDVPFHVMETGSSIYRENNDTPAGLATLDMTTLDVVAAAAGFDSFDMIKLDVQGAELDVLSGAGALLARAEVVLLETSTAPYNVGAPLFADVVAFMAARGFAVYDIADMQRQGDEHILYQCDVIFARKGGKLHKW